MIWLFGVISCEDKWCYFIFDLFLICFLQEIFKIQIIIGFSDKLFELSLVWNCTENFDMWMNAWRLECWSEKVSSRMFEFLCVLYIVERLWFIYDFEWYWEGFYIGLLVEIMYEKLKSGVSSWICNYGKGFGWVEWERSEFFEVWKMKKVSGSMNVYEVVHEVFLVFFGDFGKLILSKWGVSRTHSPSRYDEIRV